MGGVATEWPLTRGTVRALYKDETVDHHGVLQEFEALRALKRRVPRVVEL